MNALQDIQNAAQTIVEQLAERQINQLKQLRSKFNEWNGGWLCSDKVYEFVYLNTVYNYNTETKQHEPVTKVPEDKWHMYKVIRQDKNRIQMYNDIMNQHREWEAKFTALFIAQNMVKLNRALAKHINDEMTATNISVNVGQDGAEVVADVDGKRFVTFGILCGGDVQRLHYRYRSSLK